MNRKETEQKYTFDEYQMSLINHYCDNKLRELKKMCNPLLIRKRVEVADYDDLYDDAMNVLIESVQSYDRESKVPFSAYLYSNIKRSFYDWTRDRMRGIRCNLARDSKGKIIKDENGNVIPIPNVSFEAETVDGINLQEKIASDFNLEENILEENSELSDNISEFMRKLPLKARKIAILISQGYGKYQIVSILGITDSQYTDAIKTMSQRDYTKYIIGR